jgi:hypothetical protein
VECPQGTELVGGDALMFNPEPQGFVCQGYRETQVASLTASNQFLDHQVNQVVVAFGGHVQVHHFPAVIPAKVQQGSDGDDTFPIVTDVRDSSPKSVARTFVGWKSRIHVFLLGFLPFRHTMSFSNPIVTHVRQEVCKTRMLGLGWKPHFWLIGLFILRKSSSQSLSSVFSSNLNKE